MRAWVEIDLDVIERNVQKLRAHAGPGVRFMAVVKSDAYGYGLLPVARAAVAGGADWLAVANVDEGVALRTAGIRLPVLVFGKTAKDEVEQVVRHGLVQAVWDSEAVTAIAGAASALGMEATVHVDVDTGMGMTGISPAGAADLCAFIASQERVRLGGVFTHLANADDNDAERNRVQLGRYAGVLEQLNARGIEHGLRHACNTGATASLRGAFFDMVRSGCGIYGLWPFPFENSIGVEEAMSIKSRVEFVKAAQAGSTVGYGSTYTCATDSVIAGVWLGYGQGLPRALANRASVLVRGRLAPVIGKVSMNRFAIDVTGIPGVREGDEVAICGKQGDAKITLSSLALKLGIGVGEFLAPYMAPRIYRGKIAAVMGLGPDGCGGGCAAGHGGCDGGAPSAHREEVSL